MNTEDKILEERLLNWGRWNRSPKRQGRSPICAVMEGMPYTGVEACEPEVPDASGDVLPSVDVLDALLVQRAWQRLPNGPDRYRKAKLLVGVAYCYSGSFERMRQILRKHFWINIRGREFDQLLSMGRTMVRNNLHKLDQCAKGL